MWVIVDKETDEIWTADGWRDFPCSVCFFDTEAEAQLQINEMCKNPKRIPTIYEFRMQEP